MFQKLITAFKNRESTFESSFHTLFGSLTHMYLHIH